MRASILTQKRARALRRKMTLPEILLWQELRGRKLNGLFFRNAVNFGLLALECPGVHEAFEEGQTAEVSLDDFTVRNPDIGALLKVQRIPAMLLDLMTQGGLYPHLERQGLIEPRASEG